MVCWKLKQASGLSFFFWEGLSLSLFVNRCKRVMHVGRSSSFGAPGTQLSQETSEHLAPNHEADAPERERRLCVWAGRTEGKRN